MKTYDVTIVWLTNPSKGDTDKHRKTFTVEAENEREAKEKAKELDTTLFSVFEVYIS